MLTCSRAGLQWVTLLLEQSNRPGNNDSIKFRHGVLVFVPKIPWKRDGPVFNKTLTIGNLKVIVKKTYAVVVLHFMV
jgi:hypothetical protein